MHALTDYPSSKANLEARYCAHSNLSRSTAECSNPEESVAKTEMNPDAAWHLIGNQKKTSEMTLYEGEDTLPASKPIRRVSFRDTNRFQYFFKKDSVISVDPKLEYYVNLESECRTYDEKDDYDESESSSDDDIQHGFYDEPQQ